LGPTEEVVEQGTDGAQRLGIGVVRVGEHVALVNDQHQELRANPKVEHRVLLHLGLVVPHGDPTDRGAAGEWQARRRADLGGCHLLPATTGSGCHLLPATSYSICAISSPRRLWRQPASHNRAEPDLARVPDGE